MQYGKIMSKGWDKPQIDFAKKLFLQGKDFYEISEAVTKFIQNNYPEHKNKISRSPRAVAAKFFRMGLITTEQMDNWDKQKDTLTKKQRDEGWRKAKNNILKRDGKKCVICGEKKGLQFCHVIPFRKTKINKEIEAVTLCPKDHKLFDNKNAFETKKIYDHMCEKYPEYWKKYSLESEYDPQTNMDKMWIGEKG